MLLNNYKDNNDTAAEPVAGADPGESEVGRGLERPAAPCVVYMYNIYIYIIIYIYIYIYMYIY